LTASAVERRPTAPLRWLEVSLAVLSVLATLVVAAVAQRSAPGGSWHFLALADWISGAKLSSPQPIEVRDLGYPLFILLMGKSPVAVIVAQFAMAAALPLLVFRQIAWLNRTLAWVAGCLVILSLAPYQFAAWLHHDQLFIFAFTASCTLTLLAMRKPTRLSVTAIAVCWFVASISRPAANLSGLLCLSLLAVSAREQRKAIVIAALAYTVAFVSYGKWRSHEIAKEGGADYAGSQLFFTTYLASREAGIRLRDTDGPDAAAIAQRIGTAGERLVERTPDVRVWLSTFAFDADTERIVFPPRVFNVNASRQQMSDFVLSYPTEDYYEFINFAANDYELLGRAARRSFREHPLSYALVGARRSALLLWKPGEFYTRFHDPLGPQTERQRLSFYFLERNTAESQLSLMPRNFQRAFAKPNSGSIGMAVTRFVNRTHLSAMWAVFDAWLAKGVLISFVLGAVAAVLAKEWRLFGALAIISVPHLVVVFVTGLVVGADYRYHFMAVPESIAMGGLGASAVISVFRQISTGQIGHAR
jgi:hypothetical protein